MLPPKRLKIQRQPPSERGFQLSISLVIHLVEQAANTHPLPWCGFRAWKQGQVHLGDGLGRKQVTVGTLASICIVGEGRRRNKDGDGRRVCVVGRRRG